MRGVLLATVFCLLLGCEPCPCDVSTSYGPGTQVNDLQDSRNGIITHARKDRPNPWCWSEGAGT